METFDILDKDGNKTGQTVSRNEAHSKGVWHAAVHTWIMNSKGRLLFQLRSTKKDSWAGMWDVSSAGIHDCILFILVGHIQAGDDAVGTAIRELKEELSIEAKPEELEKIYSYKQNSIQKDGAFINNEHVTVFLLNKDIPDLNVLKLQKDEVEQVEWIPLYIYERELKRPNSKFVPLFNEKIKNALVQILWGHAIEYYKFPVTLTDCQ